MECGDKLTIGAHSGTVSAIDDGLVWLELEHGGRIAYRRDQAEAAAAGASKPKSKPKTDPAPFDLDAPDGGA